MQKEFIALTDQELLLESKKAKSNKTINALIIGLIIGIGIYSIVKNGFGFFIIILAVSIMVLIRKSKKDYETEKLIEAEMIARNLK